MLRAFFLACFASFQPSQTTSSKAPKTGKDLLLLFCFLFIRSIGSSLAQGHFSSDSLRKKSFSLLMEQFRREREREKKKKERDGVLLAALH